MLMLLFQLGNSRYAIPAHEVVEIASMVELDPLPMTPGYIAGLFNYRGQHVPVMDLCQLLNKRACSNLITTRMILVNFPLTNGGTRILGLLAERVTETLRIDEQDFTDTGISIPEAPFIGRAAHSDQGLVQQLSITELVPADVQSQLYSSGAA
ncbi:chemotaxis-related protein WspB [Thiogranum longum]|uniref:Chemotaxis-related protein WspB n=1 Tax=Thiogranum longum TaxID=1537524 RepID=A0A4R1HBV6_9GAMM|nr:chemotaxis protein CheW [Thiogranum longum]TCK18898.1 chemotaxis-related protein WspB [Thiogranum longum]